MSVEGMDQKPEMRGEPMPELVTLPTRHVGTQTQHPTGGEIDDHPVSPPLTFPGGSCGPPPRQAIDTGTFRTRTASMADFGLEALSLSELKKMQKDIAKAISTY